MKMEARKDVFAKHRRMHLHAQLHGHVGLLFTLCLPARFRPFNEAANGLQVPNPTYDGSTPREGQEWLTKAWTRARALMARQGLRVYGMRMVSPGRHGAPHWHVLLWAENQTSLQNTRHILRDSWLRDEGGAPCAAYRVLAFKLGWRDGLGEVDTYLTSSERASAWAAEWGVVLVTYFGLPGAEGAAR